MIVNVRLRPSRLLWRGRKAPEEAGNPEAHAAFIRLYFVDRREARHGERAGSEKPDDIVLKFEP
jgi:hypothetical protein